MKRMKKLAGLLLAMVMVFSMATTVFAAGTNTIKVTGAQKGETYKVYKMLDLSVDVEQNAYSYTVNSEWNAFFKNSGAGVAYVDIDDQGYVTWKEGKDTAADMETFAKAAAAYVESNSISEVDSITPTEDKDITFDGLDSGYYLITSTNGTFAMIDTTPADKDVVVNEKNPDPTLEKKVQKDSTGLWGDENSAQIGDTVEFKVTIQVKEGAKNYVMHDKMEDGLTFNESSVAIEGLTKNTHYTVVTNPTDGCTFEIQFIKSYLNSLDQDTTLTVTYDAVLNENADITNGEENNSKITWGAGSSTAWDTTVTKTYKFDVLKYNGKDLAKNPLAGATFQLKNASSAVVKLIKVSDTEYRVANGAESGAVDSFVTVGTDKVVIKGVDLDQYTLVETQAPAGFNKLKNPVNVVVESTNALVVEIANQAGTELPSTGGMGTTIFYILGGIMVLAAVVLLVTRKRMNSAK